MPAYPYGWILAGGFFVLLLMTAVLSSRIVLRGSLRKVGNNDDAEFNVRALFGLLRFHFKVPVMKMEGMTLKINEQVSSKEAGMGTWKEFQDEIDKDKVISSIEKYKHLLRITRDMKGWASDTLSRVRLTEWRWSTSLGTGDAMWTAMATGAVWSVKTSIIGLLSQMVQVNNVPQMEVHPIFSHSSFQTEWSCSAEIGLGSALYAAIKLIGRMRRWGGIKTLRQLGNIGSKA